MLVAGEYYLVERKSVAKIMLLRECRVKIGLVTGYILVKAALFCYATIVSYCFRVPCRYETGI